MSKTSHLFLLTCVTAVFFIPSFLVLNRSGMSFPKQDSLPPVQQECRAMFEIGDLANVNVKTDDTYEKYTRQLPSLVQRGTGERGPVIDNSTRLHIMGHSVPYIPCEIHEYTDSDLLKCSASRASSGQGMWLAFVGDSQMRLKLHLLLSVLPKELTYTFAMGGKQVSREAFLDAMTSHKVHPPSFEVIVRHPPPTPGSQNSTSVPPSRPEKGLGPLAIGTYVLRVTMVWAPLGSRRGHPLDHPLPRTTAVQEWAVADSIPDVVVVGYGLWFLVSKEFQSELVPFTDMDLLTRPLVAPLKALATRTNVMLWAQSRFREFNYETDLDEISEAAWETRLYFTQFQGSIPILDDWLWNILRPTGIWRWDTLLPFNLASLKECRFLHETNMSSDSLYSSRWWYCNDSFHTGYRTDADEFTLLLNLVCNAFLWPRSGHCCS